MFHLLLGSVLLGFDLSLSGDLYFFSFAIAVLT
jgi:hypothetical protein